MSVFDQSMETKVKINTLNIKGMVTDSIIKYARKILIMNVGVSLKISSIKIQNRRKLFQCHSTLFCIEFNKKISLTMFNQNCMFYSIYLFM